MSGEFEVLISGLDEAGKMIDGLPAQIQKGADRGVRNATTQGKRLLRAQMSFDSDSSTPQDMLGRGEGYARKGIRAAFFREGDDLNSRIYVGSKGFSQLPAPGAIAAINVAGSEGRSRGGRLPARDFFTPVKERVRQFAGQMIDDAISAQLAKTALEAF